MPRGKHGQHARGSQHPRWNGGRMASDQGYVKVRVGAEHPLADPNGYAYEHALVWTAVYGPVPEGHLVHHRNEDKADNRLGNLQLLTREEHNRHHAPERDEAGRFVGRTPKAGGHELDGRTWDEMPRIERKEGDRLRA